MILVPSISIINGKVARLTQGDFSSKKEYDDSPIDLAKQFEDHGIKRLHLVDLDSVRKGAAKNFEILNLISAYTSLDVNFAGGIQTDGDILKALEYGAESITAASIAVQNKDLFANWIMSYGRDKIALAADSLNGNIKIKGWQKNTDIDLISHIAHFYDLGLKFLKTTDISKDGALEGPAFDLYKTLVKEFPDLSIFASGGVRNLDDINRLNDIGIHGVVFGKSFYEGNITLKEIESYTISAN